MDVARWFLGVNEISPRVMSIGGRVGYDDDGETPNTQIVYQDYAKAPLIFETRGLPSSKEYHADSKAWSAHMDTPLGLKQARPIGVVVECEGGWVTDTEPAAYDKAGNVIMQFKGGEAFPSAGHIDNFIAAVRERKVSMLNADCEETHYSSALCHTGLISHQLGKKMSQGEIMERIKGSKVAAERFESMKEHLAQNGVDLSSPALTLGPWLQFDPKTERFVDSPEANKLITRKYREPFVVPKDV
jgi:hypothetical protein